MSLLFMHFGSVSTLGNHRVLSPQPGAHTHSIHHTHRTIHVNQHHAIPASTQIPYLSHVHSTTCTMCTQYQISIASHARHVPYPHLFK